MNPDKDLFPYGKIEDSYAAIAQMFNNPAILILTLTTIVSIACFNSFGIAVTKYASAAQRSTIDTSRTVLIWLFCMIVPSKDSSTYWGKIHVSFKWL